MEDFSQEFLFGLSNFTLGSIGFFIVVIYIVAKWRSLVGGYCYSLFQ